MAYGTIVILLMVTMIICVPLTIIAKHAWRNQLLTLIFALIGTGSVIALIIMTW